MPRPHPAALLIAVGLLATPALAQNQPPDDDAANLKRQEAERQEQAIREKEKAQQLELGRTKAQPVVPPGQSPPAGTPRTTPGAAGAAGGNARPQNKGPGISVQQGPAGAAGAAGAGRGSSQLRPDEISLTGYSEGIDIRALVEYVADKLQINIIASDALQGNVVLNAPVVIKKSELLDLLDALLEQHGFTIILDHKTDFYKIVPLDGVVVTFDPERPTTRIIPTPSVKPSALSDLIAQHMGTIVSATPNQPGGGGRSRINFVDDIGVIIVTDSPRRLELLQQFVNTVLARVAEQQYIRFDLEHLAASTARSRILELVGRSTGSPLFPQGNIPGQPNPMGASPSTNFDNLADRLTADAQSNALILRGYPDEEEQIRTLLAVLDKPNAMEYKQYFAGTAALQIAQLAERFGFGTVEQVETANTQNQPGAPNQPNAIRNQQNPLALLQGQQNQGTIGGPVMVVDSSRGAITYNGTASQQAALQKLIASFNPQLEVVEFRAYKIKNMPAPDMADLLTGLIFNEQVTRSDTSNSFLPGSRGNRSNYRDRRSDRNNTRGSVRDSGSGMDQTGRQPGSTRQPRNTTGGGPLSVGGRSGGPIALTTGEASPDGVAAIGGQDVFLIADEANNQVVVKASARDQLQISKLIDKLDQRRPQVNIEVQIVSVSATDDLRLAFEVQGVFNGGRDGAFNTNFGLGTFSGTTTGSTTPTNGNFVGPKSVVTTLAGLTAAVVRSDHVPIIMNALRRNADTRILSSPQLLVDDNEFAEIVSLDEQPTTQTNLGTGIIASTSFGGYTSAGTSLAVTPSISEGGYLRLEYEIELSNFVGTPTAGLPAAKQTRNVSSSSVTIPGNATIIVGGIKVDSTGKTVVKVPLIGDIPLVGHLFRDTNKNHVSTRLYVFITPRIMRDVNFGDPTLLTRDPARDAGIDVEGPKLQPIMMKFNERPAGRPLPAFTPLGSTPSPASDTPPPPSPSATPATTAPTAEAKPEGNSR